MVKKSTLFGKILVIGIVILLFLGIAIQPVFANTIKYSNELEKITVQFYEENKIYNHIVTLTREQLHELESLKDTFKAQIDSSDNLIETELIYKNTILSLNELGLLPNDMSIDYAQNLVTGKEQDSYFRSALEKRINNKKGSYNEYENIFCLISGITDKTSFAGPVPILLLIHFILIMLRINSILDWVSSTSRIGEILVNIFKEVFREIYQLRLYFWLYLGAGINFFPLKIGSFMFFGAIDFDPFYGGIIPSEGWVSTLGLYGKKSWSGSFLGGVIGFTGIKIIRDYFDFFYFGSAIAVALIDDYYLK